MTSTRRICAVVPVKETAQAKQRLAGVLSATQRQALALAMVEDVLCTLAAVPELAGIMVVTIDPAAADLATRYGARIAHGGARDGQTGAVMAAARTLAASGTDLLTVPGDVPLVEPEDIRHLLSVHGAAPAFTIVPAHDEQGSNAVLCSPADAVPLRFGDNSFFPHLDAARVRGIAPLVAPLPRIALDIDNPANLTQLLLTPSHSRARALLQQWDVAEFRKATA